jgi:hypothetical protein
MSDVLSENAKAWVALVMAGLGLLTVHFGWNFGLTEEVVVAIIAALTPIFVWLVPNR